MKLEKKNKRLEALAAAAAANDDDDVGAESEEEESAAPASGFGALGGSDSDDGEDDEENEETRHKPKAASGFGALGDDSDEDEEEDEPQKSATSAFAALNMDDSDDDEEDSASKKKKKKKKKKKSSRDDGDDDDEESEKKKKKKKKKKKSKDEDDADGDADDDKKAKKKKKKKMSNKERRKLKAMAEADALTQKVQELGEARQTSFAVSATRVKEDEAWQNATDINIPQFTISAHGKTLFIDAELKIAEGRKYGLVGPNGMGKTTLLKQIANRELQIPPKIDVLYVEQEVKADDTPAVEMVLRADKHRTRLLDREAKLLKRLDEGDASEDLNNELCEVSQELMSIDAAGAESRALSLLHGLGFTEEMQRAPTKSFLGAGECACLLPGRSL